MKFAKKKLCTNINYKIKIKKIQTIIFFSFTGDKKDTDEKICLLTDNNILVLKKSFEKADFK